MDLLYPVVRPLLFSMDAERAHDLTLRWAERTTRIPGGLAMIRALYAPPHLDALKIDVGGLELDSPIGLAAGLDKNGVAVDLWAALGFGFVEVGTVTPGNGQVGNDKPRLHRVVREGAIVNRMGFNNHGADALGARLAARRSSVPVGANLGKAKVTPLEDAAGDYVLAMRPVWANSDYLVVNVSSPNTPNLRDLQAVSSLAPLLQAVVQENRALAAASGEAARPVFLKIAPDLADEDLDAVCEVAVSNEVSGLIATNTTIDRSRLQADPPITGGISGAPLTARALEVTKRLFRRLDGALPIIGVGGIRSVDEAYARIGAGASAIQVYSGFVFEGPSLVARLTEGLAARLAADGINGIGDAVGRNVG